MGGNIWKETSVRLSKENYLKTVDEVLNLFSRFGRDNLFPAKFVREKETFGDLDLICPSSIKEALSDYIGYLGYPSNFNKDVISILYNNFQIDFIFVPDGSFEYAKYYFSWNDLGNLVGRLAKQLGFKHGHLGLFFENKYKTVNFNDYLITRNYYEILDILELDKDQFSKGFDTYFQMFEWLSKSPYFDSKFYQYDSLNHRNRVRDRKRKIYSLFLDWCKDNPVTPLREVNKYIVFKFYPELYNYHLTSVMEFNINTLIKDKFSGYWVKKYIPNISTSHLVEVLNIIKTKEFYEMLILNSSEDEIKELILTTYSRIEND